MARIVRSNLNWLTDLINEALGSIDIHPDYGYESKLFKALEDGPYHYFDIAETQLHRGYNDLYEAKERLERFIKEWRDDIKRIDDSSDERVEGNLHYLVEMVDQAFDDDGMD